MAYAFSVTIPGCIIFFLMLNHVNKECWLHKGVKQIAFVRTLTTLLIIVLQHEFTETQTDSE